MIDFENEHIISLTAAARSLPGGPVHLSTLHRWRRRGVRGVKLETYVIGGRRFTSEEALSRFAAATSEAADCFRATSGGTSQRRDHRKTEMGLDEAGI